MSTTENKTQAQKAYTVSSTKYNEVQEKEITITPDNRDAFNVKAQFNKLVERSDGIKFYELTFTCKSTDGIVVITRRYKHDESNNKIYRDLFINKKDKEGNWDRDFLNRIRFKGSTSFNVEQEFWKTRRSLKSKERGTAKAYSKMIELESLAQLPLK